MKLIALLGPLMPILKSVARTVLTPILEKNVVKTLGADSRILVSMSRCVVLAFAAGIVRMMWDFAVFDWPTASIAIATVLALPLMNALERLRPEEVLEVTRGLLARYDAMVARQALVAGQPSKYDDHRND